MKTRYDPVCLPDLLVARPEHATLVLAAFPTVDNDLAEQS